MPAGDAAEAALRLTTTAEDLARVYCWLDTESDRLAVPTALRHAMHVALEEAVANVAMHAFSAGAPGEVVLMLRALPDAAVLVVEDAGREFDPATARVLDRRAARGTAEAGGRGLVLLRYYCRDIGYVRCGEFNRLTLRFPYSAT